MTVEVLVIAVVAVFVTGVVRLGEAWQVTATEPSPELAPISAPTTIMAFPDGIKRDVVNAIGMSLRLIPAGEFTMGSPSREEGRHADMELQHRVRILRPFYLGAYEVTQEEYEKVMGVNPSFFSALGPGMVKVQGIDTRRLPVEQVSWVDATTFCQRLSEADGATYRLPSEAEWEYACRAGTTTPFYFGESLSGNEANCDGNWPYGTWKSGPNLNRTTAVGSYAPNPFGLYDMHGNVCEWCADWLGPLSHSTLTRGDSPRAANVRYRPLRGGRWSWYPSGCRSAFRGHDRIDGRYNSTGFRVMREL